LSGGEYPSFSKDGEKLVFIGISDVKVREKGGTDMTLATMSINVLNIKTNEIQTIHKTKDVLLDAGYIYSYPSFSPDGKLAAYQHSGSDVSGGFSVVNLKGKTIFRYPPDFNDPTPYWKPQFTPDGKEILCYSPTTFEDGRDKIFLIDIKNRTKKFVTEGSNPAFACKGRAIIFERWTDKWRPEARSDLWFLELQEGAEPRMILKDGSSPSGYNYCPPKLKLE
jgi:Tol biopolymer transport system component